MSTIEDVVGEMIAWDADLCIVPPEGVIVEDIAHKVRMSLIYCLCI